MRVEKRRWIFRGLAVPEGVAAVSSIHASRPKAPAATSLLVVGVDDRDVDGLSAPMRRLSDPGWAVTSLTLASQPNEREIDTILRAARYDVALWLLPRATLEEQRVLDQVAQRHAVRSWWLVRYPETKHGLLTARDYAAWAARLWRSLA